MGSVIFLALLFVAMWVFVVLPQQRRQRAHRALVSSLEVGDEVMTTSGMKARKIRARGGAYSSPDGSFVMEGGRQGFHIVVACHPELAMSDSGVQLHLRGKMR